MGWEPRKVIDGEVNTIFFSVSAMDLDSGHQTVVEVVWGARH